MSTVDIQIKQSGLRESHSKVFSSGCSDSKELDGTQNIFLKILGIFKICEFKCFAIEKKEWEKQTSFKTNFPQSLLFLFS